MKNKGSDCIHFKLKHLQSFTVVRTNVKGNLPMTRNQNLILATQTALKMAFLKMGQKLQIEN
jgi:hypothetical protein